MIQDYEQALIQKAIENDEIYKLLNVDIGKCLYLNGDIWTGVASYHSKYRQPPTLDILKNKFPEFEEQEVADVSIEYLIDEVQTTYLKNKSREILEETIDLMEGDPRKALAYGAAEFNSILHVTQTTKDVDLAGDYRIRLNSLEKRITTSKERGEILGIPTSIPAIDYIYGGLQKGDFVVVMGWTGSAKTWLCMYLAIQAWIQGYIPLYFSLEMDDEQFGYRFDTLVAGGKFSNISLMNGRGIDFEDYTAWAKETFEDKQPFHLVTNESVDGEVTQQTVVSKIEQYRPDVVFLDYHGLMEDARRGKGPTEQAKNLSRDFKKIAGRYAVPIVDIAGVTMEDGHGERLPRLNEIAWAKALAYDSDLVVSMYKEGQIVHCGSEKTRRCQPFAFTLSWDFDQGVVMQHDWDDL